MNPPPLIFKRVLRLICISEYMEVPKCCSYDIDESEQLLEFLNKHNVTSDTNDEPEVALPIDVQPMQIDTNSLNGIHDFAGAVLHGVLLTDCAVCDAAAVAFRHRPEEDPTAEDAVVPEPESNWIARSRDFTKRRSEKSLISTTSPILRIAMQIENLLKCNWPTLELASDPVASVMSHITQSAAMLLKQLPACHDLGPKFLSKYVRTRMYIHGKEESQAASVKREKSFASKSAS